MLTLQRGVHFAGTVVADKLPAVHLGDVRVSLTMTGMEDGWRAPLNLRIATPASGPVAADGTFDIAGIVPGTYVVSASGIGSAWLRSVLVEGQDVLDVPLEFEADQDRRGATLVLSSRRGQLSGLLLTPAHTPALDLTIVMFPTESQLWRAQARRVRAVRPASDGRYVIDDIPGGE